MKAARTQGTHSLAAALHAAKPAAAQLSAVDSFQTQLQGKLTPDGIADVAQQLAGGKGKALKKDETPEEAAAAKLGMSMKKLASGNEVAGKDKAKHASKSGDDASSTADGAHTAIAADAGSLTVPIVPVDAHPVDGAKKDLVNADGPAINSATNSASTSTLQQAPLPVELAAAPVGIAAAAKQVEALVSEGKSKRILASSTAVLSEKPATATVSSDGLMSSTSANGMALGNVGGQAMQGGHSSGSSGHEAQQPASQPMNTAGPQVVASTPSQLDVGVYDDTHGWLRIRAELGAGGAVNASVTSADAAHESLKTALPAMTHYLGTEAVHVNSIELHKFGEASAGQQGSQMDGQQQHSSLAGQHSHGDGQGQSSAQSHVMAALDEAASRNEPAVTDVENSTSVEEVAAVSAPLAASTVDTVGEPLSTSGSAADVQLATEPVGLQMTEMVGAQFLPWQVGVGGSGGWVNVSA